jgi:hypothetical protein
MAKTSVTIMRSPTSAAESVARMLSEDIGGCEVVAYPVDYPGTCTHEVAVFVGKSVTPIKLLWNNEDRDLKQAAHQLGVAVEMAIKGSPYKSNGYRGRSEGPQTTAGLRRELGIEAYQYGGRKRTGVDNGGNDRDVAGAPVEGAEDGDQGQGADQGA